MSIPRWVGFVGGDASDHVSEQPVDVASCLGATWIGGGTVGTLELLGRSLAPGGIAVVGECFWRGDVPSQEVAEGCWASSPDEFATLPDLIETMQAAGWDLVEMVLADEDSWDGYVAAQWLNLRRFIDAHPDDEIVPELRAELATAPARYARYQRPHLGWGAFALMRR